MSNVPPPPPPPPPYGGDPNFNAYPQAPGYGAPYGGAGSMREHPAGTTVLVLGILSLVICSILGPIAWVKGGAARKEMAAQPGVNWTNRGQITAGWICGIIATCMLILVVLGILLLVAVGTSSS